MTKHYGWAVAILLLTLLLLGLSPAQAAGEPYPGTVGRTLTLKFYPQTTLVGTDTVTSDSPYTVNGQDITLVNAWHSADIFATVDITPDGSVTVIPLLSADGEHWAEATYTSVTADDEGEVTVTTHPYQLTFTEDGTQYLRLPIAGERLKFQIAHTDAATPTIHVTLRND